MRTVFLFFLLVNAAYFYTQSDFFRDQEGPMILKPKALPKGAERLTLLRERGLGVVPPARKKNEVTTDNPGKPEPDVEKSDKQAVAEKAAESPEPVEKTCFTLGPFVQASTAGRTAETISELGVTVNRRQTEQRRPRGYWVYLPEFKTYKAAQNRVKELQNKGLNDLFIMGDGEHKNAISLGLFKNRVTADERLEQVKKMGLSVKMETQYRVTKLAWLDIEVPGERSSAATEISDIASKLTKTTLAQRKCK